MTSAKKATGRRATVATLAVPGHPAAAGKGRGTEVPDPVADGGKRRGAPVARSTAKAVRKQVAPATASSKGPRKTKSSASAKSTAVAKKPGASAKKPAATKKPGVSAKKPAATKKPAAAKKQAAPAKGTATAAKKPVATKKPGASAKKPSATKKPAASSKKPAATKRPAAAKKPAAAKRQGAAKRPTASAKKQAAGRPVKGGPLVSRTAKAPAVRPYAKDQKFLDEQRLLLEADRAVYQEQATDLRAEADSLAQEREPGDVQFDEESGEGGTVTVDRERDLALSAQAMAAVEEIDGALARIADGTYGVCERCHQAIPKPRLRALPHARLCVACKSGGLSRR